jgi:hypothetical protein
MTWAEAVEFCNRLAAATYGGVFLFPHQRGPVTGYAPELVLEGEPGAMGFRPGGTELAILYGDEVLFWDGVAEPGLAPWP